MEEEVLVVTAAITMTIIMEATTTAATTTIVMAVVVTSTMGVVVEATANASTEMMSLHRHPRDGASPTTLIRPKPTPASPCCVNTCGRKNIQTAPTKTTMNTANPIV